MALDAGLSSADEHGVPQGESSQSYRHRAGGEEGTCYNLYFIFKQRDMSGVMYCSPGQYPEEDDTLVSSGFTEGVGWRRGLIITLKEVEKDGQSGDISLHCFTCFHCSSFFLFVLTQTCLVVFKAWSCLFTIWRTPMR